MSDDPEPFTKTTVVLCAITLGTALIGGYWTLRDALEKRKKNKQGRVENEHKTR